MHCTYSVEPLIRAVMRAAIFMSLNRQAGRPSRCSQWPSWLVNDLHSQLMTFTVSWWYSLVDDLHGQPMTFMVSRRPSQSANDLYGQLMTFTVIQWPSRLDNDLHGQLTTFMVSRLIVFTCPPWMNSFYLFWMNSFYLSSSRSVGVKVALVCMLSVDLWRLPFWTNSSHGG